MKPILSVRLARIGWSFEGDLDGVLVELCTGKLENLFPRLREAKAVSVRVYRRSVPGGVKLFFKKDRWSRDWLRWGETAYDCEEAIIKGDEAIIPFLILKPRPFWLKVTAHRG